MNFRVSDPPSPDAGNARSVSTTSLWNRYATRSESSTRHHGTIAHLVQTAFSGSPAADAASRWAAVRSFAELSEADQQRLQATLGSETLRELISLAGDSNQQSFHEALLLLAHRETSRHPRLALAAYTTVSESGQDAAQRTRAAEGSAALRGGGTFGDQWEHFTRNLSHDTFDPSLLLAMSVAGATFQTLRLGALAPMATRAGSLSRIPLGARMAAWSLAFGGEVTAFSLTTRGLREVLVGPQDWSRETLQRDLLSCGLTLFALKGAGAGSRALLERPSLTATTLPTQRWLTQITPQVAMFGAVLGSRVLERAWGLRPEVPGESLLAQSLATLIHFNVSANLLRRSPLGRLDSIFAEGNARLDRIVPRSPASWLQSLNAPKLALNASGVRVIPGEIRAEPLSELVVHMTSHPHDPGRTTGSSGTSGDTLPTKDQIQTILEHLDTAVNPLMMSESSRRLWAGALVEVTPQLIQTLDVIVQYVRQMPERNRDHVFLAEIRNELERITALLHREHNGGPHSFPPAENVPVQRALTFYYKGINTLINYLNDPQIVNEPLNQFRFAANWLRYALGSQESVETTRNPTVAKFPYLNNEGSFELPDGQFRIVVLGDDNGMRTRRIINRGHHVIVIDPKASDLLWARNLRNQFERRERETGVVSESDRFHLVESPVTSASYHADLLESYYLPDFDTLPPRVDAEARHHALNHILENGFSNKLSNRGSGFVLSDQIEAIEDLSKLIRRHPRFQLLAFQAATTNEDPVALRGGRLVVSEPGEQLFSWLVFRRRSGDTTPPPPPTEE